MLRHCSKAIFVPFAWWPFERWKGGKVEGWKGKKVKRCFALGGEGVERGKRWKSKKVEEWKGEEVKRWKDASPSRSIFSPLSYLPYVLLSKNISFCQKRPHPNHSLSGVYGPASFHLFLMFLMFFCQKNMSFCQKRVYAPNHSLSGVYGPVASNLRVHMAAENFPASA